MAGAICQSIATDEDQHCMHVCCHYSCVEQPEEVLNSLVLMKLKQVQLSKVRWHLHISTTHTAAGGEPLLNMRTLDLISAVLQRACVSSSSACMTPCMDHLSN